MPEIGVGGHFCRGAACRLRQRAEQTARDGRRQGAMHSSVVVVGRSEVVPPWNSAFPFLRRPSIRPSHASYVTLSPLQEFSEFNHQLVSVYIPGMPRTWDVHVGTICMYVECQTPYVSVSSGTKL